MTNKENIKEKKEGRRIGTDFNNWIRSKSQGNEKKWLFLMLLFSTTLIGVLITLRLTKTETVNSTDSVIEQVSTTNENVSGDWEKIPSYMQEKENAEEMLEILEEYKTIIKNKPIKDTLRALELQRKIKKYFENE